MSFFIFFRIIRSTKGPEEYCINSITNIRNISFFFIIGIHTKEGSIIDSLLHIDVEIL